MSGGIIDPELRRRLAAGDDALAEELLGMLAEELGPRRRRLAGALAAGDLETVAREAHTLAGGAAYCGAVALKAAADALEQAARSGDCGKTSLRFARIDREVERLLGLLGHRPR